MTGETETPCNLCGGSGNLVVEKTGDEVQCSWCGGTGKAGTDPRDALIIEDAVVPKCKHGIRMNEFCKTCKDEMDALPDPD